MLFVMLFVFSIVFSTVIILLLYSRIEGQNNYTFQNDIIKCSSRITHFILFIKTM